jgi:ADP-heptose:LPS heptosyltransferase
VKLVPAGIKIKLIKRIDPLIGVPLTRLLPTPINSPDSQVRSILVIRPGGIGDALLLAPALSALKTKYEEASITILAERRNAGAFALVPYVDRVLLYDSYVDFIELLFSRYDLIIDTEQWHRMSAIIARLIPSATKIGFDTNERRRLFTHAVPYSQNEYEAQSFLNLLKPLGINKTFANRAVFLINPDTALLQSEPLLNMLEAPYIALFPGASVNERRWGVHKFSELVKLLARQGINTVIIGGEEDQLAAEAIVSSASGLNMAGKTSIAGTAAIIAGSKLLVSSDSGVLHIGAGLAVPTVSLFGAGIAQKWAPQGEIHTVLNRNLVCSPCTLFGTTPVCPDKLRCLEEIEVETVFSAVIALLDR